MTSTVLGVVERMLAKRLLTRKMDPQDRRRVKLSLTAAGRRLRNKAPHPAQGHLLHELQLMREKQVGDIQKSVAILVKAMEANRNEHSRFFFSGR